MALNGFFTPAETFNEGLKRAWKHLRYGDQFGKERIMRYDFFGTPKDIVPRLEQHIGARAKHFICKWILSAAEIPAVIEMVGKEIITDFT